MAYTLPDYGFEFEAEPQLLGKHINDSNISLGDTPEGRAFALKALDPSQDGLPVLGMPDITTEDIVVEQYKQFVSIIAPVSGVQPTDSFNYIIRLTGNIIAPFDVFIQKQSSPDNWDYSFTYLNSQMNGVHVPQSIYNSSDAAAKTTAITAAFNDRLTNLVKDYQNLRGLYNSLTIKQMSSQLTDQGYIVACQQVATPKVTYQTNGASYTNGGSVVQVNDFLANDFPALDNAFSLSRTYQNPSRDGVYLPLHLDNKFDEWKNIEALANVTSPIMAIGSTIRSRFATITNGTPNIPQLFQNTGHIFINGVAPGTSFQLMWRGGYEGLPFSGSASTTHSQPSPAFDQTALNAVSQLTRKHLMFAYPASWNDGHSLWNWIKSKVSTAVDWIKPRIMPFATDVLGGYATSGNIGQALSTAGKNLIAGGAGSILRSAPKSDVVFY